MPAVFAPKGRAPHIGEIWRNPEIARTLREHGHAGLVVADQKDPLHLLIAGYALGQAAAAERGGAGKE